MPEPVQVFKYPGKEGDGGRDAAEGRKSFPMCQTDNVISTVQVFEPGVHNKLHFHGFEDGYWFILGGQATFYGEGDSVYAVLNPREGLLMPAKTRYWFKSTGEQPLEILRVNYRVGAGPRIGEKAEAAAPA
jgi:mannose-6-phosphate isomerase-like protein (cupin superfamily)